MQYETPPELGDSGREMYAALALGREVSAAHKVMILNAARMADRLDELTEEIGGRLTTTNSQGTETINPVISEHRMLSTALAQILAKLGVSELPKVGTGKKTIRDELAERRAKREAG